MRAAVALSVLPGVLLAVLSGALLSVLSGCAQAVNVKVPSPHTRVIIDGKDLGEVPESGETIEVRPGMEPLRYSITNDDRESIGSLARTEPLWWIVAAGVTGAVCCVPTLAGVGFCLANPVVLGAPLAFAATGDVGALTATFVAPSWLTLPLVTTCGAVGLTPLGLAFVAETVPAEVTLAAPPSSRDETAMAH